MAKSIRPVEASSSGRRSSSRRSPSSSSSRPSSMPVLREQRGEGSQPTRPTNIASRDISTQLTAHEHSREVMGRGGGGCRLLTLLVSEILGPLRSTSKRPPTVKHPTETQGGRGPRQARPPLALFKAMLLAMWYDLSDGKLAEALDNRATFRRYCGFSRSEGCYRSRAGQSAVRRDHRSAQDQGDPGQDRDACRCNHTLLLRGQEDRRGDVGSSTRDRRRKSMGSKAHVGVGLLNTALIEQVEIPGQCQ